MQHWAVAVCAGALLVGGAGGGYFGVRALNAERSGLQVSVASEARRGESDPGVAPSSVSAPSELPAERLEWSELLEPGAALAPSAKSRALAGKRVRLVGFMAQMEVPSGGAFYLVPRPIACDEAGGGTADLMPASVLVISESAAGEEIAFIPGALDVSGIFEVGNQAGPDGRVSAFRLRLTPDEPALPAPPSAANGSG